MLRLILRYALCVTHLHVYHHLSKKNGPGQPLAALGAANEKN